jgi:YbbR domain-containing protein
MIRLFRLRRLGFKLASVILAALLWLVVAGEQVVERALKVPVEFTNLPSQIEMVGEPPTAVDVRVRGSSGVLSRLTPADLAAIIDLRDARPGQRLVHIASQNVQSPFGVEVVQVTPSNMSMTFEPSATKIVPVVPSLEGQPAEGFVVGRVTAEPGTVTVVGPASVIETTTEAITGPVSVAGATAPIVGTVDVGVSDPLARLGSPQRARVRVEVVPAAGVDDAPADGRPGDGRSEPGNR